MQKIFLLVFIFIVPLYATKDIILTKDQIKSLAAKNKWLELLYFNGKKSEVLDTSYFLSPNGNSDPLAELEATIKAYSEPFDNYKEPNQHPRCRFPARYYWIDKEIGLPNYSVIDQHCSYLKASFQKTQINSISLMFVTGYLGNPASSFGHSFIKLNTAQKTDLFDLSISYGADVPKGENIFLYIYRGLFGKYSARFTDKYFYSHDLIYTGQEQRDIWEYRLNMSQEQILFFRLHMWEILHKKFKYLFLNQNCGYEVAKATSIVLKKPITISNSLWYAPIETFYALNEMNKKEKAIKQVIYHPSAQKILYNHYTALTPIQRQKVNIIIQNESKDLSKNLKKLDVKDQIAILDFLTAYYNFMLQKDRDEKKYKHLKYLALVYRISLPPHKEKKFHFDVKSPTQNDKPSLLLLQYGISKKLSQRGFTLLSYAPYAIESIGNNNLNGDELVVLKLEAAANKNSIAISRFDLINIWQFNKYPIPKITAGSISWHLNLAYEARDIFKSDDFFFDTSIGKSWYPFKHTTFFAMANASLHSFQNEIMAAPQVGIRISFPSIKFMGLYKRELDFYNKEFYRDNIELKGSINIKKNISCRIFYKQLNSTYSLTSGIQFNF